MNKHNAIGVPLIEIYKNCLGHIKKAALRFI